MQTKNEDDNQNEIAIKSPPIKHKVTSKSAQKSKKKNK